MRDYATRVAELTDVVSVDALLQRSYPELMGSAYEESVIVPALKLSDQSESIATRLW